MKKLLLFFCLLIFKIIWSQQDIGQYILTTTIDGINYVRYGDEGGEFYIRVYHQNGEEYEFLWLQVGDGSSPLGIPNQLRFSSQNRIVTLTAFGIDRNQSKNDGICGPYAPKRRRSCGIRYWSVYYPSGRGATGQPSYNNNQVGTTISYGDMKTGRSLLRNSNNIVWNEQYPVLMDFVKNIYSPAYRNGYCTGVIDILPDLVLKRENSLSTLLPIIDKIKIYAPKGFDAEEYNWEYSLDAKSWISLPQYAGRSLLDISATDILGNQVENYINKKVYFRTTAYKYGNLPPLVQSNVLEYSIRLSSPHITKTNVANTSCFDQTDGSVKLTFDRQLQENETINLTLQKKSLAGNFYEFYASHENLRELNEENTAFDNLPPGDYRVQLVGFYKGFPTYTDGSNHSVLLTIQKPAPVTFQTKITPVYCKGGQDGVIEIIAQGGQGSYLYQIEYPDGTISEWIPFLTGVKTQISHLLPGEYKIQVKDTHECYARELIKNTQGNIIGLGQIILQTAIITEPEKPVNIAYVDYKEPSAFGFTNGTITAQITGGTPYNNSKLYNYTWTYQDGTVWTHVESATYEGNEGWFITLKGAPAGKYTLTVTDANYEGATDQASCTVFESEFILSQPDPIVAKITLNTPISCNVGNEYGDETDNDPRDGQRDESQNGRLQAKVSGGVKPYTYTWKKQTENQWQIITTQSDQEETSVAYYLSDGNYAFNVKDANGIILGEYINNELAEQKDEIFYLHQPEPLTLSFEKEDITCYPGNNGFIKAIPLGGVAPYSYEWTTGSTEPQINHLIAGVYKVIITDAAGCRVEGSIVLQQPGEIVIEESIENPTCYGGNNGSIHVQVTGGVAPYQYLWNTGDTHASIDHLSQGIYTLTVTDARGCIAIKPIEIQNPEEYKINLGGNKVLCNGQSLDLDATLEGIPATYSWESSNGFSSPSAQVTLTDPGNYRVTAITEQGCIVTDEINIYRSNVDIDAEFLLATQAYVGEEVILVNVSRPQGETTQWWVPNTVKINNQEDQQISLNFPKEGNYIIGLTSTQGECSQYFEKNIIVEQSKSLPNPGTTQNPLIKEFTLTPNPNQGEFKILVKLSEESPVVLRVFNTNGQLFDERKIQGKSEYEEMYHLLNLGSSVYIIVLETSKGTLVKRMITY
ncbi:T9SS type A sorting domain-containing protein [Apibacter muscae]|uniref:T9SS type A sorting domain-containing protein n=1 Tax=Apibacter muscae TaxID=2509004 RepID=UPI0011ACC9FA|nr:T9SS type A sorting domain-containing protein [Apibacter muscae]TWP29241.1 T9SS type A sorting domain-containing protein [Apibacter muscae]